MSRLLAMLCVLPALLISASTWADNKVLLVLSSDRDAHAATARTIEAELAGLQTPVQVTVTTVPKLGEQAALLADKSLRLVVTIGASAARGARDTAPAVPLLHTLIPRQSFSALSRPGDSAIFLDQPFARQFDLLRLALPNLKRVAVVLGPSSAPFEDELQAASRARQLRLAVARVENATAVLPTLNRALEETDVLMSVPDPMVLNSETLHHLLLTTYRHGVPMLGLSRAYVEAGALAAVYSTPEQIGRQAGELLRDLAQRKQWSLPPPQAPRYFSVAVNRRVAGALSLELPPEEQLLQKLQASTR